MFRFAQILMVMALGVFSATSQAASFDCRKATTFVEKAICQNDILSALDDELSSAFNMAMTNSKNPKALKKQQLNWLKTKRNVCQTNTCLETAYQDRIAVLNSAAGSSGNGNVSAISGEYVRYNENGKPDYHAASLTVFSLEKGKAKITGSAIWIGDVKMENVHTGEVDGTFVLQGDEVIYQDGTGCQFILLFGKNALTINNDNGQCGGANVTFNGYYKKIK